jgi:phosphate-selective porin
MPNVRALHCSWALLLLGATIAAAQPAAPAQAAGYTIFVRGTPIGREDVSVDASATGTTITSTGRLSAPLNVTLRRSEFR